MELRKYINKDNVQTINDGFLKINGDNHLVFNIKNQQIEVLNKNGIYEYVEDNEPELQEDEYIIYTYEIINNVIHKIAHIEKCVEENI